MKQQLYRGYIEYNGDTLDQFITTDQLLAIAKVTRLLEEELPQGCGTVVDLANGNIIFQAKRCAIC